MPILIHLKINMSHLLSQFKNILLLQEYVEIFITMWSIKLIYILCLNSQGICLMEQPESLSAIVLPPLERTQNTNWVPFWSVK